MDCAYAVSVWWNSIGNDISNQVLMNVNRGSNLSYARFGRTYESTDLMEVSVMNFAELTRIFHGEMRQVMTRITHQSKMKNA